MNQIKKLNICIVSRKNIYRNTRVARQAKALSDAGHNVYLICFSKPHDELLSTIKDVTVIEVSIEDIIDVDSTELLKWRRMRVLIGVPVLSAQVIKAAKLKSNTKRIRSFLSLKYLKVFLLNVFKILWRLIYSISSLFGIKVGKNRKIKLKAGIKNGILRLATITKKDYGHLISGLFLKPIKSIVVLVGVVLKYYVHGREYFRNIIYTSFATSVDIYSKFPCIGKEAVRGLVSAFGVNTTSKGVGNAITRSGRSSTKALLRMIFGVPAKQYVKFVTLLNYHIYRDIGFACVAIEKLGDVRLDYVQSHDYVSLLPAEVLRINAGAELVYDAVEISEHRAIDPGDLNELVKIRDNVYRLIEKNIFVDAKRLLTVGEMLSDWYHSTYKVEQPVVLRNCRYYENIESNDSLRNDCGISDGETLLLWFGGGYPKQGILFTLDILKHMDESTHLAMLVEFSAAWKGFERKVHNTIAEYGLSKRVHLFPLMPPNELIRYASSADVGLIPRPAGDVLNVQYSLPNKLFEMISSRLPIVTTDLPNIVSIVKQYNNGAVIDSDNAEKSAEIISELVTKAKSGAMVEDLERVAQELSWENESIKLIAMYDNFSNTNISESVN